ncbi:MAG: VCBS repeat-containing protein [Saprospiraceae bacterium]|nr:VCBS repeat-containing protein [Saprospiraceae bacterium]
MKPTNKLIPLLFWSVLQINLSAQERLDIPVLIDNKELVMPWNGGFNAPQFANIDLNHDGVTDMISFDRQGDMLRTYIHLPASGRWMLDWNYAKSFPPGLVDWVQVVDYNQDGIEDLFTSSSASGVAGATVYKGSYANDQWSFTEKLDRGKSYLQVTAGGGLTNLYVNWDDIPAITDIDGDGDVDILVFEPGGSLISYFANQSIEKGWGLDSLRFELKDLCWGKVLENELSETVYLSENPDMCSDGNFTGEEPIIPRHVGSTILALDIDADGDKDAFVGDISSRRIIFLHNGRTAQQAWITELDNHYPSQDTSINLPYFVGSYSVQLDDDPEPEFIAAINSRSLTEDKVSLWRYDDDPSAGPLNYKLTEKGFLQNEMIDLGSHSRPAVEDINGDGLLDVLVGGYTYSDGSATRTPSLWYFENKGTLTQPYFALISDDYLQMSQFANIPTFDFAPAFGDIDNNGTIDLIVGEQNGKLFFHKNNAAVGDAMSFAPVVYPYMNIAVGVSATPQIVDINGDGLGDLVVGERTGNADNLGRCSNLNYFENVGTPGNAIFNADATVAPNTQCFGRLLFDIQPGLPQYSTPAIVRTQQGLVLMTGGDPGQLLLYDNVENGKTGAVTLVDDHYGAIDVGNRSAPALADFNHDGVYELIVGNQRGGLELFSTDLLVGYTSVADPTMPAEKPYHIDGTIGSGVVDITWKSDMIGIVHVFDILGRPLSYKAFNDDLFSRIDLSEQTPGIYFLRISVGRDEWVEKVVKE